MTTTGELRAIIEELKLVDIGDAAEYLGEGMTVEEEFPIASPFPLTLTLTIEDKIEPLAGSA